MTEIERIMVVDDDVNLLNMMGMVLEQAGYQVIKADSGFEALKLATEEKPNLIVLDVMMPGINGIDTCRRLRDAPATRPIPILMLSALERIEDKLKGFEAGVDDYVSKPVNPKELVARVKALLMRSSLSKTAVSRSVAFIGAKGGVGTTTLATNVAVALSQIGRTTTLAEMRPSGGTIRHHFKLTTDETLLRLLQSDPFKLKRPEIENSLIRHRSGLSLLLAPVQHADIHISPNHVDIILETLTTNTDYVIIDLPPILDIATQRTLELSDQIVLVMEPDTLSLLCAQEHLRKFREWGMFSRTDVVLVNRVRTRTSLLSRVEVETKLGMREEDELVSRWDKQNDAEYRFRHGVIASVPSAPEMLHEAIRGHAPYVLIEPGAPTSRAFQEIADWLVDKYGG